MHAARFMNITVATARSTTHCSSRKKRINLQSWGLLSHMVDSDSKILNDIYYIKFALCKAGRLR